MSNLKVQASLTGTGVVTLTAPTTNTDRTVTLPDATGTVNISGAPNEVPAGSASAPAIYPTGDSNTGVFFPAADIVAIATGGTERVRTDSSGNVGIGTSSPGARLHVANSGGDNVSIFERVGGSRTILYNASGDSYFGTTTNTPLRFATNDVERARIDSSGNLVQASGCRIYSPGTYNNTTGNAANMHIATDGHFFRSTSSLKYKTDVQDAVHGLAEVLALRPVTYKGKNDGDLVFGGLIAEEVHEAGLTEFVQYAQDGSPDALAYGNMVSLCIKAIQEQQVIIDAQQAALNQLTTRIAALEAA